MHLLKFTVRYPVFTYVLCCLIPVHGILWPLYWSGVSQDFLKPLKIFFAILPTFSAMLITFLIEGEEGVSKLFRKMWPKKVQWLWVGAALFIFATVAMIALLIRYLIDDFFPPRDDFSSLLQILVAAILLIFIPGFFEEFGWRGFMQERLSDKYSVFSASLLVGLIWGAWHYMDFLMGNWAMTTKTQLLFMIYILATAVIIGWIYVNTKSIFMAMLAHFGANIVNFFIPLWNNYGNSNLPVYFYISLLWGIILIILFVTGSNLQHRKSDGHERKDTA